MKRIILSLCLIVFLNACSSSSKSSSDTVTNYYLLDAQPSSSQNTASRAVVLTEIRVPDYLRQPKLVMREDGHKMTFANYHKWAEFLPASIHRALRSELEQNSLDFRVSSTQSNCEPCFGEVSVLIDHFYPTSQGEVVLAGSVELRLKNAPTPKRVDYNYQATLESGGYNNAVAQMRSLLGQLASDIKTQLAGGL